MKKITLLLVLFVSTIAIAQEKEEFPQDINKRHELKLNTLGLIAFEWVDVSYEYLINEESSVGLATIVSFNSENSVFDEYRKFSLTPYYRRYFSNKFARGFFVEGFGVLHSYENRNVIYNNGSYIHNQEDRTSFALGVSVGGKFVSKKGFTAEIYLGVGRNLGNREFDVDAVGRAGITLGYRF